MALPAMSISGTKKSPRSNRAPTSSSDGISASYSSVSGPRPMARPCVGELEHRRRCCRPASRRRAGGAAPLLSRGTFLRCAGLRACSPCRVAERRRHQAGGRGRGQRSPGHALGRHAGAWPGSAGWRGRTPTARRPPRRRRRGRGRPPPPGPARVPRRSPRSRCARTVARSARSAASAGDRLLGRARSSAAGRQLAPRRRRAAPCPARSSAAGPDGPPSCVPPIR